MFALHSAYEAMDETMEATDTAAHDALTTEQVDDIEHVQVLSLDEFLYRIGF